MDKQPIEKINALIILSVVSSLVPCLCGVAWLLSFIKLAEPGPGYSAFWDHGGGVLFVLALGAVVVVGIPFAVAAIMFAVGALRRSRTHRIGRLGEALTWLGLFLGSAYIVVPLIWIALSFLFPAESGQ